MRASTRRIGISAGLAVLICAIILLAARVGPYACFLDLLNAQIGRSTTFRPFYAGLPGLPSTRELIPELGGLEDAYPLLRIEAMRIFDEHQAALLRGEEGVPRMDATYNEIFRDSKGGSGLLGGLKRAVEDAAARAIYGKAVGIFTEIGSGAWRTFNLILYNLDVPGNAERCPQTVRLLKRVPGMQSALLSFLAPGAYIPPHSDPAKGVIRYHLAFKVPRDRSRCFISVDGQRYHWKEGAGVLFDDAFDHWVRNDTDEHRVILFVDILRPLQGARAKALQGLANAANRRHPGVRRLIQVSRWNGVDAVGRPPPVAEASAGRG